MQETNNNGRVGRLIYSDVRHKLDIQLVDVLPTGIKLYRYRYRWSATEYVGVLAQEVAAFLPEAVCPDADGSLRVDYARLGLQLRTCRDWLRMGHAPLEPPH